jgi:hypothetical protein
LYKGGLGRKRKFLPLKCWSALFSFTLLQYTYSITSIYCSAHYCTHRATSRNVSRCCLFAINTINLSVTFSLSIFPASTCMLLPLLPLLLLLAPSSAESPSALSHTNDHPPLTSHFAASRYAVAPSVSFSRIILSLPTLLPNSADTSSHPTAIPSRSCNLVARILKLAILVLHNFHASWLFRTHCSREESKLFLFSSFSRLLFDAMRCSICCDSASKKRGGGRVKRGEVSLHRFEGNKSAITNFYQHA